VNLVLEIHWCCIIECQLSKNNDKSSPFSVEFAEKNAETYKKLRQFAGHGQNCELAAKREIRGKIVARKITILCKDY